jgi:polyisoprenoid-binding protein YceI
VKTRCGSVCVARPANAATTVPSSGRNHTQVEFAAKHLGMTVRGHFAEVSSVADIDPDHREASSVEVTIQAASIRTHNETRDNDLRSSNFLQVDKFPTITFNSTGVVPAGTDRYTLTGDLTIKAPPAR